MFDRHTTRNTMRVRTSAQQKLMLLHIFQVGFDDLGTMVWMVDLNADNRYLGTQLIQQVRIIEGEVLLATTGVSNQTYRPTAVRCLHRLRHIGHTCAET